jgi:hypothetical protein
LTITNERAMHRLKACVWLAWLGLMALVTARSLQWEVNYFGSPGPIFQRLLCCALLLLAVACPVYVWLRNEWLARREIPLLAGFCGVCLLVYQPIATIVVALLFLACLASGCRIARLFLIPLTSSLETLTLGFGLGCAVLIPILFGLGLFHLYYAPAFALLLVLPCVVFRLELLAGISAVRQTLTACASPSHPLAGIAFVFSILGAVSALAVALSPSIAFDPLAVHLAAARYYSAQHALAVLPTLPESYYPQGGEVLMALAWSFGGQPAAQLISPLFWILSLLLLFLIARSCGLNKAAAFVGVGAAALLPFAHWDGSNSKNDWLMVFFQAAALLTFLRWLETRNQAWIPVGALLLGSTFAIKHVALFGAIPLVCFFLYATRRLRPALVFCAILAASALYWQARAAYLTGNPLYPAMLSQSWSPTKLNKAANHRRWPRIARVLWNSHFDGTRLFESPLPNPVGLAFLVFLPLAILVRGPSAPARRACLLFCLIYLAYWMPVVGMLRYAILPISLLVMLLAGKATSFYDWLDGRLLRATVAVAVAGVLLFAILGIAIIEVNAPMLMLFARRIGSDQYLNMALRTHRSLAWLAAAHPSSTILGIDNCSRAYAPDPARFYCALHGWHGEEPGLVRCGCEYVVQPGKQRPDRDAEPVFSDAYFTVWQFKEKGDPSVRQ